MDSLKITADTNIWVSGLNYSGKPKRLLDLARDGEIEIALSAAIIVEAKRILENRFGWPPEDIAEAISDMRNLCRYVIPRVQLDVIERDPDDNRIVECAVSSRSDYIVTGDKDLLALKVYDAIRIVTVSEFLAIWQSA